MNITMTSEEYVNTLEKLMQSDKKAALDFAKECHIVDTYIERIIPSHPFKGKNSMDNLSEPPKDLHIII